MPTDHRHPTHTRRHSVRAMVLAWALSAAVLGVSAEYAGAASRGSGVGAMHVSAATSRTSSYRMPARASKSNWATSQRLGSRIVRLPPGGGDHPPRRLPHWPHRPPILIGLPTTPSGPTGVQPPNAKRVSGIPAGNSRRPAACTPPTSPATSTECR